MSVNRWHKLYFQSKPQVILAVSESSKWAISTEAQSGPEFKLMVNGHSSWQVYSIPFPMQHWKRWHGLVQNHIVNGFIVNLKSLCFALQLCLIDCLTYKQSFSDHSKLRPAWKIGLTTQIWSFDGSPPSSVVTWLHFGCTLATQLYFAVYVSHPKTILWWFPTNHTYLWFSAKLGWSEQWVRTPTTVFL